MFKTRNFIRNDNGFTLVELMVVVFLTAIAVISIYRGYTSFSQAADAQQQVMEMQQNLRIGMTRLVADIRRSGMNEEGDEVAGFVCDEVPTNATSIEFTMDLGSDFVAPDTNLFATDGEDNDNDGIEDDDPDAAIAAIEAEEESRVGDGDVDDVGERIRYSLYDEDANNNHVLDGGEDSNGNGVLDEGHLRRGVWKAGAYSMQTVITNVEALNFVYFDKDGAPLDTSIVCPAGFASLSTGDMDIIDRVEITLVVRTTNEDYRIINNRSYQNLQDVDILTVNPPDNFRRRAFSMSVQIRNNI